MIDITEIVVAVIGLLSLIVTSVVVPLIKSKLTNSQLCGGRRPGGGDHLQRAG